VPVCEAPGTGALRVATGAERDGGTDERAVVDVVGWDSTAKANGLEPYVYLRWLFAELPKATTVEEIEALMPFQSQSVVTDAKAA
jgi:IS66 C-terminal element